MKKLLILHCAIGAKSQFDDIAKSIGNKFNIKVTYDNDLLTLKNLNKLSEKYGPNNSYAIMPEKYHKQFVTLSIIITDAIFLDEREHVQSGIAYQYRMYFHKHDKESIPHHNCR